MGKGKKKVSHSWSPPLFGHRGPQDSIDGLVRTCTRTSTKWYGTRVELVRLHRQPSQRLDTSTGRLIVLPVVLYKYVGINSTLYLYCTLYTRATCIVE